MYYVAEKRDSRQTAEQRLMIKMKDMMYAGVDNAVVLEGTSLHTAIIEMGRKGLGMVTVIDHDNRLKGVIAEQDLCRIAKDGLNLYQIKADSLMNGQSAWITMYDSAIDALRIMSKEEMTGLPVLDRAHRVIGTVLLQDIFQRGLI